MRAGRLTAAVVFAATVVWPASSQNAELNCKIDDQGRIYLNGQQVVVPKKVSDPAQDTTAMPIALVAGRNVLGIYCHDGGFTGGIVASIDLNSVGVPETVRTDATWKCVDGEPAGPAWYTDADFSETGWRAAGEYGTLADDTGGNPKPFFQRTGLEPYNLYMHKALWLWTPKPCYIRRSFQGTGALASVMLRGNGIQYRLYLNGALVGERSATIDRADPIARWDNVATVNGENVIAIEALCDDSIAFAWFKAGVQWGPTSRALSDSTWKFSWDEAGGWRAAGFDDAAWLNIGTKSAYDPNTDPLATASWIWPTDMSFRYVFDVPTVGVRCRMVRAAAPTTSVGASHEYFTLLGKRLCGQALSRLSAGAMLVERRVLPDGTTVLRKGRPAVQAQ